MKKYLYLKEVEWAETWINGGKIPIYLASTYLGIERKGIMTPDENLVHKSNVDIARLPGIRLLNVRNASIIGTTVRGKRIPDLKGVDFYKEDGLVLSFCNSFSEEIAKKLGKKVCVRILNMEKLLKGINKQIDSKGLMKECVYTSDHQRNHFLKSMADSWQDEFRIFWKDAKESRWVEIPAGTAEFIAKFWD